MAHVILDTKLLHDPKLRHWKSSMRWCWIGCLLIAAESPHPGMLRSADGPLSERELASLLDVDVRTVRKFITLADRAELLWRSPDGTFAVRRWQRYQAGNSPNMNPGSFHDVSTIRADDEPVSRARDPYSDQEHLQGGVPPQTPPSAETTETETETEAETDAGGVYRHWQQVRRRLGPRYDRPSSARLAIIERRLAEFSVDELRRAIDGVALDPWPERQRHDDLTTIFRTREAVDRFLDFHERGTAGARFQTADLLDLASRLEAAGR